MFIEIPTYQNKSWSSTVFHTREEFRDFLIPLFKEPGQYKFNDVTSSIFNEQGRLFEKYGYYCLAPLKTKDFIKYWDDQKAKCRNGIIVIDGEDTWYITRDYYMWLNFLPIYDKEEKRFAFAKIRDAQYHMALYEILAELHYKHAVILKKRQIASSYFHMAKFINQWYFEQGAVLKLGASLRDYINEKGSWKFLNEYKNFLNEHTAWYRPAEPDKVGAWQQQIKVRINGRDTYKGLKGTINLYSFEKDPTNGVGGPVTYFFHEEAGIAPKMNDTYGFMKPALKSGHIITGQFIAAGSVGDLDQCGPLKEYILNPEANGFYGVESNLIDKDGTIGIIGLFIPEQWSMPPYIDEHGNSLVEEALEALEKEFEKAKRDLEPAAYQLTVSQHPRTIEEAFASRKLSVFPPHLIAKQQQRIAEKTYSVEYIELSRDAEGKIIDKPSRKTPIMEWPVSKNTVDKEGVICIYERPHKDPSFGMYYASVDPVAEGKAEYINNMLYTPTGKKRIGDIKIGDAVMNPDGTSTLVTGVFPQGQKELYRVFFNDGFSILVCKEHLWSVYASDNDKINPHVLSVDQLLDLEGSVKSLGVGKNKTKIYNTKTYYKKGNTSKWKIPITNPLIFDKNEIPLDPYFLGLLLGDGGISTRSIHYTSADKELIDHIKTVLPPDISIKQTGKYDYRISTSKSRNSIMGILRSLNLQGTKSQTKFIPEIYKYSSIDNRLALLQGLMDTDGYCGNHGAEYYSISFNLANDVVDLVHSLGGIARIRKKITNKKKKNGVGYIYIVRVSLPKMFNPFRLKRKSNLYKPSNKFSRYISDIKFEKIDEAICISVENPNNLYITEHGIVTHNTTTSDSLCSIYVYKNPRMLIKDDGSGKIESSYERDGIVASWCGRFDDLNKTHERLELLIEWYNAWTVVENNVALFIQYMISKKKQRHLVPKSMILFLKDIGANSNVFQEYGWKNVGTLFKGTILSYAIEFLKEELDTETLADGTIVKTIYGVERIPDPMLLKEMQGYQDGVNVDRLVAFAALIAFAKVQQSNRGMARDIEYTKSNLDNSKKFSRFNMSNSPFRHMGNTRGGGSMSSPRRSAFKNIR
jgi:hypothetical protein